MVKRSRNKSGKKKFRGKKGGGDLRQRDTGGSAVDLTAADSDGDMSRGSTDDEGSATKSGAATANSSLSWNVEASNGSKVGDAVPAGGVGEYFSTIVKGVLACVTWKRNDGGDNRLPNDQECFRNGGASAMAANYTEQETYGTMSGRLDPFKTLHHANYVDHESNYETPRGLGAFKNGRGLNTSQPEACATPSGQGTFQTARTLAPRQTEVGPAISVVDHPEHGVIQGLNWYKRNLKMDIDGDVADEFLMEEQLTTKTGELAELNLVPMDATRHLPIARRMDMTISDGRIHVVYEPGNVHLRHLNERSNGKPGTAPVTA